ncbi:zinc finger MYM-type protein 1-like [Rana temporaria]|uniref:zinc finger MYM-type protein 1-like n=1 Tax=Rana temporaria TaxID=8407 RepID=UPI001AAD40AF|nr:zinc finger MYM-type protein 1-like [Rana temporaria]XP_040217390.1 zinc finger MYM-type protein 1-like [Rana temporaria]
MCPPYIAILELPLVRGSVKKVRKNKVYYVLVKITFSAEMKRNVLSGAQKRKKAAEEKEKMCKLPKLTSWLNPGATSASSSAPPDVASTSTCTPIPAEIPMVSLPDPTAGENPQEEMPTSVSVREFATQDTDPGLWDISNTSTVDYWIRSGPTACQNHDCNLLNSGRVYKGTGRENTQTRYLSKNLFKRELRNGECVKREWLLYSPSQGRLYCFACRLFSKTESPFATSGYNDWKHSNVIGEHENGEEHRKCMTAYFIRHKETGNVDTLLLQQLRSEQEYWHKVLTRVVSVIRFLASRGLPFRGENQIIGSAKNGNYLGILELLSEFDPFLEEHLKLYGNPGKGNPSYLSANICEEFIEIMGQHVLSAILEEIKESKYYSISVDSTPDISHTDQLTFTVRYIRGCEPVERFLKFIPIFSHGAKNLADTVVGFLKENKIPLSNCRGQSYDNASNMSGRYTGLQARILQLNEFAMYVPCAGHSLNLVGVKAAECCLQCVKFFDFVQRLYSFFSASTHRWNILATSLGKNIVVKRLSDTRWSAHFDAVHALHEGFEKIKNALDSVSADTEQEVNTRREAKGLSDKMENLETIFLTILWNDVLERVNKTSKVLQSEDMNILVAMNLLESLKTYLQDTRDRFSAYELKARSRCPDSEYKEKREGKRSVRLTRYDGSEEEVLLSKSEKFKVETFLPVLDSLIPALTKRAEAYSSIGNMFSFFCELKTIRSDDLKKRCEYLANVYHKDLDYGDLLNECEHLKHYMILDQNCETLPALYRKIISDNLKSVFPNVEIALRVFMCMMVTNCAGERSFSRLKLIKNELRSTMGQHRLNWLSLMCIENDILKTIDFKPVIKEFCTKKCRKFNK